MSTSPMNNINNNINNNLNNNNNNNNNNAFFPRNSSFYPPLPSTSPVNSSLSSTSPVNSLPSSSPFSVSPPSIFELSDNNINNNENKILENQNDNLNYY